MLQSSPVQNNNNHCPNTIETQDDVHLLQSEVSLEEKLRELWDIESLDFTRVTAHLQNTFQWKYL